VPQASTRFCQWEPSTETRRALSIFRGVPVRSGCTDAHNSVSTSYGGSIWRDNGAELLEGSAGSPAANNTDSVILGIWKSSSWRHWHDADNPFRRHGRWPGRLSKTAVPANNNRIPGFWSQVARANTHSLGRLLLLYCHVSVSRSASAFASSACVPRESPNRRERNTKPPQLSTVAGCLIGCFHYRPTPLLVLLITPLLPSRLFCDGEVARTLQLHGQECSGGASWPP